jgi:NTE family protein
MKRKKVALVIGAGSVKSAAALGALRVLRQAGIDLDLVVGCSGGALYATAVALGMDVETAVPLTRQFWSSDLNKRRNWHALRQAILPKRLNFDGRFSLRDDARLLQWLDEAFGGQTFADTPTPLFITATDFMSGEQVVLQNGRLRDAIRASLATPFVFAPWEVNGRLLTDGYLSDPLPVNVASREGADVIIALGFETPHQQVIDSPLRYALQLSSIMTNSIFKARLAFHNLSHHAELLLLIPQFPQRLGRFEEQQIPATIAAGEAAMAAQLPYLQTMISDPVISEQYSGQRLQKLKLL